MNSVSLGLNTYKSFNNGGGLPLEWRFAAGVEVCRWSGRFAAGVGLCRGSGGVGAGVKRFSWSGVLLGQISLLGHFFRGLHGGSLAYD